MNEQNEIIEMARQAGAASGKPTPDAPEIVFTQCLDIYHFAKLVAAKEREETDRLKALCNELLSELYVYRASKYLKDTTEAIRTKGLA
jgi:hypothetical protein